jgi:hypothetical protein
LNDIVTPKRLVLIFLPLTIIIFYLTVISHINYTPDDSYIYFHFAKNIVNGNGFAFNAHEPTYGVTSPLWVLIISSSGISGVDYILTAKIFDILFASMAVLVFFLFASQVLKNYIVALLSTFVFSMNTWFLRWSGTGMETSLAVLLTLLTLYYCWKHEYLISIFFSGLLFLTRPETVVMPILIITDIYLNTFDRKRALKNIVLNSIFFLIIVLPWLIYAKLKFGSVIPNTALAKATLGLNIDDFAWTIKDLFKTLFVTEAISLSLFIVGVVVLIYLIFRKQKHQDKFDRHSAIDWLRGHFVPLSWVAGIIIIYILTQANIVSRYLLLIIPVIIIYAYTFLSSIVELLGKNKYFYTAVFILTIVIMLQNQIIFRKHVQPSINSFTVGMNECFIPLGEWLKDNTPADAIVFTPDIGAIGYYSERKICDAAGLISPELLSYIRRGFTYKDIMDQKIYEQACKADYVVHRANQPNILKDDHLQTLFYKTVYGLGLSNMETVYYTVYKVNKN